MLKILINSYACCPEMGSEQGMGWNWITTIAKECNCYVVTESEYKDVIEAWLQKPENADLASRLHFYFVPVGGTEEESAKIRQMCWNQGTWAFYPKYKKWQEKALTVASQIVQEQDIDLMHQLNMAGFREPGMLYKIDEEREKKGMKRIPIVWGPMTGYGSVPFSFMTPGGLKFTCFYLLKNFLNWLQLIGHHRVRKMIQTADKLIAATPEMKEGVEKYYHREVEHINETGCKTPEAEARETQKDPKKFKVLWVGRFIYTKQLELALKTIAKLTYLKGLEFHVVGQGFSQKETADMHYLAEECELQAICHWHGQIPNEEVQQLMKECDVFFFTSIFEATSTVILEAIQNGLPIVCFDRCGFGPIVDKKIGIKIPCKSPQQAMDGFADALKYLYNHRELLPEMSRNCKEKQIALSWDSKQKRIMEIYKELTTK